MAADLPADWEPTDWVLITDDDLEFRPQESERDQETDQEPQENDFDDDDEVDFTEFFNEDEVIIEEEIDQEPQENDFDEEDEEEDEEEEEEEEEIDFTEFFNEDEVIIEEEIDQERKLQSIIEHHLLPCLSAKSLLRLKSTSRHWNRWISSPLFINTHSILDRPLTGLFFHSPDGSPCFSPFSAGAGAGECDWIPDPSLSFLPEPVHIKSSTRGLLLCRGRRSATYYVCNPITTKCWSLPPPINHQSPSAAAVIVFQEPLAFNFSSDFHIACAFEVVDGIYGFETFSSAEWGWRISGAIVEAERIVEGSGVAAAGMACWRTTMQSVVAYDPAADAARILPCPAAAEENWEIGEFERRLCCVAMQRWIGEVLVWEDEEWRIVSDLRISWWSDGATPMRTQGGKEVVVWEGSERGVVARDVMGGGVRRLVAGTAPAYCADFVPYVSSLVHVIDREEALQKFTFCFGGEEQLETGFVWL